MQLVALITQIKETYKENKGILSALMTMEDGDISKRKELKKLIESAGIGNLPSWAADEVEKWGERDFMSSIEEIRKPSDDS